MRSTQPSKQARRVAVEDVVPVCREASLKHATVPMHEYRRPKWPRANISNMLYLTT